MNDQPRDPATEVHRVASPDSTRVASYLAGRDEVTRVLLLYSGGLDTSVMLKWIQDEYEAEVVALTPEGDSTRIDLSVPAALGPMLAPKGSVTLDGVSLTVNEVADQGEATHFSVNVIPHTWQHTTLGDLAVGRRLNVEIDVLARYLQRMMAARGALLDK